ncbi:hypothetical protein BDZ88DRAFT_440376 [Geranomyces variabilis]|nr:hypothetical protein BDZ88DRAFT_440376 [Geranomyces variabilis]KAJ3136254.1 hypothetical protein HDU90_003304 [Geranomyces variabilis]
MALTFADLPLDVKHAILDMVDAQAAIALGQVRREWRLATAMQSYWKGRALPPAQSRQPTRHGLRKAGVILPRDVALAKYCLQKIDVKGRLVSLRKGKQTKFPWWRPVKRE